jgi:hypothetical protein
LPFVTQFNTSVFLLWGGDEKWQTGHKEMEEQMMQMGFFFLFFWWGEKNESKSPHYGEKFF